ncbi:DUF6221 family protein [Streptomyces sp. NPDC017448]|uniref:DUF6221 family protein n=1 Tax=Streptomyces sp. NPDC017448 TaxID=3364996 RepID=UPI00378AD057
MDDLVQFLRARYDEDAELARQAAEVGPLATWDSSLDILLGVALKNRRRWAGAGGADALDGAAVAHAARHDPARVLAEVEAKQRIIECHEPWTAANGDIICGRCGREHVDGRPGGHFPCQTLRLLALPYAAHPDYQDAWRP